MATTTYFLAPNARWQGRDPTGQPAVFGKLYTYVQGSEDPKATYINPEGTIENDNPVDLDAKGEANIYWASDDLYYIRLYDKDGNLVYDQDKYPTLKDTGIPVPSDQNSSGNFVRNPQFTFWSNSTNFPDYNQVAAYQDDLADDWYFYRNNATATVNISRGVFDIGQSDVPGSPLYYMHYESTGGSSETAKFFGQTYKSVQTLAGTTVSFAFWAKSSTSSTVEVGVEQIFGTGGSPSASVDTTLKSASLTPVWQRFSGTALIPSVAGKTIGTNGDDVLQLFIDVPKDSFADSIDFTNCQFQKLPEATEDFPYLTQDDQFKRLNSQVTDALFKTGDFKLTLRSTADTGWALANDQTIGNSSSGANLANITTKALYELIWGGFINRFAPIYNSDGTFGARGSTAEADFNANKRLSLTKTVGRVLATQGQAQLIQNFTADPSTDAITVSDASVFYTGTPVEVSTTGTLPSPLAPATTYYVFAFNYIANELKLATSLANAVAGVTIDITTTGTGTQSVSINYSNCMADCQYEKRKSALNN